MQDLDKFVVEALPESEAILEELSRSIGLTREMFTSTPFDVTSGAWGYRVMDEEVERFRKDTVEAEKLSQSTASMIVASLLRGRSIPGFNASSGFPWDQYPESERWKSPLELRDRLETAIKLLATNCLDEEGGLKLSSTTYGANDILSLSWYFDVFRSPIARSVSDTSDQIIRACEKVLIDRADKYVKAGTGYEAICDVFQDAPSKRVTDARIGDSMYILLRFVRCLKALETKTSVPEIRPALARAAKRFQSKLHDHLSLAEITDSRFDPAELAFCLEGLLQVQPEQVDGLLLERAIAVLGKAQTQSAYWRSETPIVIQQRGHVLFPIGVETARSILNSISLFVALREGHSKRVEIGVEYLGLLRRYWAWLRSRQTAIKRGHSSNFLHGWHSEHINDAALIHTWETSQILEFLLAFRRVLSTHVAERLLSLSRLDVRRPGKPINWDSVVDKFEPYSRSPHDVYARIGADFVRPRLPGAVLPVRNWSMLLFGPPGTGKSTVAENLGDCLGVPVVTVTVSDFLGEGESRMEARVKNIFTVIEKQVGSVILFDEMDQFLLDRNSELFRAQDSVFQFLTPGMLTKFAKLRRAETAIFIIATNFEERIDPAIKRTGRIDQRYLVLPPDSSRRRAVLESECAAIVEQSNESEMAVLLESSCLLAYADIKNVAATNSGGFHELEERLREAPRNVRFSTMSGRFASATTGLVDEVIGVLNLIDEAQRRPISVKGDWEGSSEFHDFMGGIKEGKIRVHYDNLNAQKLDLSPPRSRSPGS